MAIIFNPNKKIFTLQTAHTTYQMQIDRYGFLLHLYYGKKTEGCMDYLLTYYDRGFSGNPYEAEKDKTFSLDTLPQEYTAYGNGDYRINGLETEQADGSDTANLKFEFYEITKGKYSLKGLPAMFAKEDEAETLEIVLTDRASGLKAHLLYGVFPHLDVITRAVRLENTGTAPVTVKKAMSMEIASSNQDKLMTEIVSNIISGTYLESEIENQMIRKYIAEKIEKSDDRISFLIEECGMNEEQVEEFCKAAEKEEQAMLRKAYVALYREREKFL